MLIPWFDGNGNPLKVLFNIIQHQRLRLSVYQKKVGKQHLISSWHQSKSILNNVNGKNMIVTWSFKMVIK